MNKTGYILGISRGHNSGVCLLKDGEIVFALEEERLSRLKYDSAPYAAMMKVLEYTDKIDYLVIAHTTKLKGDTTIQTEYIHDDVYTALCRKMGLIDRLSYDVTTSTHPQVIDFSHLHHKVHAACAFYRSGFDEAAAVVVDGSGSAFEASFGPLDTLVWEIESIYSCSYPDNFKTLLKHYGTKDSMPVYFNEFSSSAKFEGETGTHIEIASDRAGITKVYEAVTEYCGFPGIEAGKTMGLFPYGKPNSEIPNLFVDHGKYTFSNRSFISPHYPQTASLSTSINTFLHNDDADDVTKLKNRRDLAYAVQTQTQQQLLNLIIRASELSGKKNVVLSGGYGLNCVANYFYLEELNKRGIKLHVEPISNDGGTAIGAALWFYHANFKSNKKRPCDIYLGPQYNYSDENISNTAEKYGAQIADATDSDIIDLLRSKKIVAFFQGRSENGPRALGNRSLLFDPTYPDGKDFVNQIKRREYFRPFAGTILEEDVHEWFDLRGMDSSPHMMYAVNCLPGVEEKIPSIIHVDGTCRIQTVSEEQNPLYYRLIKEFKNRTGIPIVFNTSFNLGGEPLVETLDDAVRTLHESQIEYLYLPEYSKMIFVPNWKNI